MHPSGSSNPRMKLFERRLNSNKGTKSDMER
jgi:hypothetical protein